MLSVLISTDNLSLDELYHIVPARNGESSTEYKLRALMVVIPSLSSRNSFRNNYLNLTDNEFLQTYRVRNVPRIIQILLMSSEDFTMEEAVQVLSVLDISTIISLLSEIKRLDERVMSNEKMYAQLLIYSALSIDTLLNGKILLDFRFSKVIISMIEVSMIRIAVSDDDDELMNFFNDFSDQMLSAVIEESCITRAKKSVLTVIKKELRFRILYDKVLTKQIDREAEDKNERNEMYDDLNEIATSIMYRLGDDITPDIFLQSIVEEAQCEPSTRVGGLLIENSGRLASDCISDIVKNITYRMLNTTYETSFEMTRFLVDILISNCGLSLDDVFRSHVRTINLFETLLRKGYPLRKISNYIHNRGGENQMKWLRDHGQMLDV